jgi:hypothetical protein
MREGKRGRRDHIESKEEVISAHVGWGGGEVAVWGGG